jgi:hypothetical protein
VSRAARTLGAVVAVLCLLVSAAWTTAAPAHADRTGASGADAAPARKQPGRAAARDTGRGRPVEAAPRPPVRPALSIEALTPARLVPGSPVQVSGTVLNRSRDVWGDAQVGMMVTTTPLTSREQIAAATRVDPYRGYLGEPVLTTGTFDDIGDIAPGQSRSFAITVPYAELGLTGEDGVYWVGIELRATDDEGLRGSVARTLTFMPLLSPESQQSKVDLALLWPLLAPVPRNREEFLDQSLAAQFADGGRLRRLAELGASSREQPLTWVLGPAVLDAARHMADGFTVAGRELAADSDQAVAARQWLQLVRRAVSGSVALTVPYGNPDVASLTHARIRPGMRRAKLAAERVLNNLGIARQSLLWPAGGMVDRRILTSSLEQLDSEAVLLSRGTFAVPPDRAALELLPTEPGEDADGDGTGGQPAGPPGRPALVVDRERSRQGLRAQPGQSTLQWRQLLLSSTALLAAADAPVPPRVVAMPSSGWWPDEEWEEARLFASLAVPWIDRVSATSLLADRHPAYRGGFRYPRRARRRELGAGILDTLREVQRTSRTVNQLLTDPEGNRLETDKAFGLSSSTAWRADRDTGRRVADDFLQSNRDMIRSIDLETPSFVTLSSDSGRFPVSITNNLDQPVTVDLQISPGDPRVTVGEVRPVTLQRDQRVTVSVLTSSRRVGITTMTARMVTEQGRVFGPVTRFRVRTTQLGVVVWVVMGIGGTVLFLAAARRIVSRVRRHRRSAGRLR